MTSRYKIKNWKLFILGLLLTTLMMNLGLWQLRRAKEKKALIHLFEKRMHATPLTTPELSTIKDVRFYQATLTGTFDNQHTLLLDNKIVDKKVGYEIYTPFFVKSLSQFILVDRGFTPMKEARDSLTTIPPVLNTQTITGLLNTPPRYVSLGEMKADNHETWPLKIEYIDIPQIKTLLNNAFYPLILQLPANNTYEIKWEAVTMPPEKHLAYAVQWFALSLTLLILSLALQIQKITIAK